MIVTRPPLGPEAPSCRSKPSPEGDTVHSTETVPVPSGTVDGSLGFVVEPIFRNSWAAPRVEHMLPPPTRASTKASGVAGVFEQAAMAAQANSAGHASAMGCLKRCLRLGRIIDTRLLWESIRGSIPRADRLRASYLASSNPRAI